MEVPVGQLSLDLGLAISAATKFVASRRARRRICSGSGSCCSATHRRWPAWSDRGAC